MATMKKSNEDKLNAAIAKAISGIKPPEQLTVSQWADKKRKLSLESSAEVGQWRTSRTPYLKEIMDAFTDPLLRHIAVGASSQIGKSECLNNMIGYVIDQDPASILFVQPTNVDAKEYSKLRIAPMIRDTKCLKNKVADAKSRDSANTILQKSYPGGILTMCGSTEAHALCSKPVRYLFGDERDRWAPTAGDEGDPWLLAKARQITFYNSKSVEVSTPTIKGASSIEKAYALGTQERWETRCPHCGEYSEVIFENIRFEYETTEVANEKIFDITEIHYVCPKCGAISTENGIKAQPAKWVAYNPEAYKKHQTRSFWINSWASPWAPWKSTILEYLQAIGNSKKMQVVYNTRFGKLWEDRGDTENEDSVMARREDYGTNEDGSPIELPDGVLCLTCGIDTQDDRMEYEVVGHGHFDETWGIKKGIIMGRPDSDEVWARIDDLLDHVFRFKNGIGLKLSLTFIDEGGHYTQVVRARCRDRFHKKVFAIKGRGGESIPYTSPPKKQKIVINGKAIGLCWVYEIGVDAGKQNIMDNLHVQTPGSRYCHFPKRDDYSAVYFKGLISERLVYMVKKDGTPHKNPWQWQKIPGHERNEALDCRNYAIAAAKALSPDFDALERKLRGTSPNESAPVTAPQSRPQAPRKLQRKGSKLKEYYDDW